MEGLLGMIKAEELWREDGRMFRAWLFWGRINEYGQIPAGEYAKAHAGTTFLICVAMGLGFYLLLRKK